MEKEMKAKKEEESKKKHKERHSIFSSSKVNTAGKGRAIAAPGRQLNATPKFTPKRR